MKLFLPELCSIIFLIHTDWILLPTEYPFTLIKVDRPTCIAARRVGGTGSLSSDKTIVSGSRPSEHIVL